MRVAVLSDLHLGEPTSVLTWKPGGDPTPAFESLLKALQAGADKYDYLVLLGDLFDLGLASFAEAWEAGQAFFSAIEKVGLTNRIIYVPGNHDFTMWHYFEQDIHITRRTQAIPPKSPEGFSYSVPGILTPEGVLEIPSVNQGDSRGGKFTGGFFRGLWNGPGKEFAVVYPNLYIVDKDVTLLTHGQYFDGFWNFLGKICLNGAHEYLKTKVPGELDISELVQANYPTSVLNASAIGQAGIFSKLAQSIAEDIGNGDYSKVEEIKNELLRALDEEWTFEKSWWGRIKECFTDAALGGLGLFAHELIEKIKHMKGPRFNAEYVKDHLDDVRNYLLLSRREYRQLRQNGSFDRLIFGHTHIPSMSANDVPSVEMEGAPAAIPCYNTGGWIKNTEGQFNGAVAVFDNTRSSLWTMTLVTQNGIGQAFPLNGTGFSNNPPRPL